MAFEKWLVESGKLNSARRRWASSVFATWSTRCRLGATPRARGRAARFRIPQLAHVQSRMSARLKTNPNHFGTWASSGPRCRVWASLQWSEYPFSFIFVFHPRSSNPLLLWEKSAHSEKQDISECLFRICRSKLCASLYRC